MKIMIRLKLLISLICVISMMARGQSLLNPDAAGNTEKNVEFFNKFDMKNLLGVGDTLWVEDFSEGHIPADWEVYDSTGHNYLWIWSVEGPNGCHTWPPGGHYPERIAPINSTTAANGFMMLPSDYYNTLPNGDMDTNLTIMNSYLKTMAIDCSADTSVMVVFQQQFRYCCSESTARFSLGVSNDGVTWYEHDLRNHIVAKKTSEDPEFVRVNITNIAAGQSTVYLRFWQSGVSQYYWMIDDIALVVAPDNDLQISRTYISSLVNSASGTGYHGFYSKIPTTQIMPMFYECDVKNIGNKIQTGISLTMDVKNQNNTQVFTDEENTNQMPFDSLAAFVSFSYFTPPGAGAYTSTFHVSQDQTDQVPQNNTYIAKPINVTYNKIFARDASLTGSTAPSEYANSSDGDFMGLTYFITNQENVSSISAFISAGSDTGGLVFPELYWNNRHSTYDYFLQISGPGRSISPSDIGTWVTFDLYQFNQVEKVLIPHTEYCAGLKFNTGNRSILLGADDDYLTHMFNYESRLRIGGAWGWVNRLALVRLNLEGAILPPVFTTAPVKRIKFGGNYVYQPRVNDPNGLNISISPVILPVGLTLTDHGDGTALITGYPDGLQLNDSVMITIGADNGKASNIQNYYIKAVDMSGVSQLTEKTFIYPNPSAGKLMIVGAANSTILVYNILGERIASFVNTGTYTMIDLSPYGKGSYCIQVISGGKVVMSGIQIIY
ncbi:MAG: T9SS type A sorting domain-containing protein [Bacteroidia bacterium]|nr:T9SS type A sorting domain-containing protein [Bacteroidia bacterium]